MDPAGTERRLAAIMFTGIVGYTALMAAREAKGLGGARAAPGARAAAGREVRRGVDRVAGPPDLVHLLDRSRWRELGYPTA